MMPLKPTDNSDNPMPVSVIIPVFNAASYVREAVESALAQPETAEVVLVEDGSPDDSLKVCRKLEQEYTQVKLYQHPGGENRGAGLTRDLGIARATHAVIAFLDADDLWQPGHLAAAAAIMTADPTIDGVYGATAWISESEAEYRRLQEASRGKQGQGLIGPNEPISPDDLFAKMCQLHVYFSIITLVMKQPLAQRVGFSNLRLEQDIIFTMQATALGRLASGTIDRPTALYRVHPGNRSNQKYTVGYQFHRSIATVRTLSSWSRAALPPEKHYWMVHYVVRRMMGTPRYNWPYPMALEPVIRRLRAILLPTVMPRLLIDGAYWRNLIYFLMPGKLRPRL
jgi:glycosyltransferase involved in cell wall biosynthesis